LVNFESVLTKKEKVETHYVKFVQISREEEGHGNGTGAVGSIKALLSLNEGD
jgi:hypothetical protein